MKKQIVIYTDGSCHNKSRLGGWGAVLKIKGVIIELSGCAKDTTNNRMELTAAIAALSVIKTPSRIKLFTDSEYVQKGASRFIRRWSANKWHNAVERNLKNLDLWKRIKKLNERHEISWLWVPGHAGIDGNERADKLAGRAYRKLKHNLETELATRLRDG